MPKAIKKRAKKKVESEVEIQGVIEDIKGTLKKKKKTILVYSIIGVSAALVFAIILYYQYTEGQKSRQLETRAYNIYYSASPQQGTSNQAQYQQALDLFQQAYSKRKSPRVLLYIASSYAELGKYDEALKTLNDFTKKFARAMGLLPIAYEKMASIQLKKGDREAALKTLDTLSKVSAIFQDYALIGEGRILEQEGKKEEATAKYRELVEKFPGSPFVEEAKARLGEKKEG
jgi:predicted negative regulator of RcsB-dependent stress response